MYKSVKYWREPEKEQRHKKLAKLKNRLSTYRIVNTVQLVRII